MLNQAQDLCHADGIETWTLMARNRAGIYEMRHMSNDLVGIFTSVLPYHVVFLMFPNRGARFSMMC